MRNRNINRQEYQWPDDMPLEEAQRLTEEIHEVMKTFEGVARKNLLSVYEGMGWRRMGYETWEQYGKDEFLYGRTYIHYLLKAAIVERNLNLSADLPVRVLRQLSRLDTKEEQEIGFARMKDIAMSIVYKDKAKAHQGKITERVARMAVDEMIGPEPEKSPGSHNEKSSLNYLPSKQVVKWYAHRDGKVIIETFTISELAAALRVDSADLNNLLTKKDLLDEWQMFDTQEEMAI